MNVTKTLQWIQKHPNGELRANVLTRVTGDDDALISESGADLTVTDENVAGAAAALEALVATTLGATLPPTPETAAPAAE